MSILRERQIRQILDDENILKRQVIGREKAQIKDYEENIKPPQIIDNKIVETNNQEVNNLISFLNELYSRLKLIENNHSEFIDTFSNNKGNEYRKYLALLNIVKPFNLWEKLMNLMINPSVNIITKEQIQDKIQYLTPYLKQIIDSLDDTIKHLCYIFLGKFKVGIDATGKFNYFRAKDDENAVIDDATLFNGIFNEIYDDDDTDRKDVRELKKIDPSLIREHIEAVALYKIILRQIEQNNLTPITKQLVAYEITDIIKSIDMNFRLHPELNEWLKSLFKDTEIPELSPYFKGNYGDFLNRYDELQAMNGHNPLDVDLAIPEGYNLIPQPEGPNLFEQIAQRIGQRFRQPQPAEEEPALPEEVQEAYEYAGEGKPKRNKNGKKSIKNHIPIKVKPDINEFNDMDNDPYNYNN